MKSTKLTGMSFNRSNRSTTRRLSKSEGMMAFGLALAMGFTAQAETMTAVLQFQEKVPVEALAQTILESNSPMTRAYTVEEIRQISGPDEADYQAAIAKIQDEGFEIVQESATRLSVTVKADHQLFEKVFATQFAANSKGERLVLVQPSIPSHLDLIRKVSGLGGAKRRRHMSLKPMAGLQSTPSTGLDRTAIAALYGFKGIYDAGYNGAGQDIAIATYGDVNTAAVEAAYNYYQLSPMSTVDKVTFNGKPTLDDDAAMETSLDAEFSGMIAPGARVHVYTSATNDDAGELAMFTKILDDGIAPVVNYSWGGCEAELAPGHAQDMNTVFARAVAQGVNITVASGDNGSNSCGVGLPTQPGQPALPANLPKVDADWPAANPYVIAVGGTSISSSAGKYSETAWTGSGGGVSKLWPKPAYQNGVSSYSMRAYPDVSFNADPKASPEPVYVIYKGQQGWAPIGGTSMAAPQWAGILTLVNAARERAGKPRIGFLNPILYGLGSGVYTVMRDITKGSNGAYSSSKGYDAVSGIGSPKADNFFTLMIQK